MGASMKVKAWKEGESGQPSFPSNYKVTKRWEGNCCDVKTNHNKYYHAEIQVAPNGQARIFTTYGRVGAEGAKEHRYYPSETACQADYESLVSKKRDRKKEPYTEIDLAITSVGSEGAKAITKPMTGISVPSSPGQKSSLHAEIQRLVRRWFGDTGHFVQMNLKCPLGQLSVEQIDKGRAVLDDCRNRVNAKRSTGEQEWDILTSQFYSLVPHVLPRKIDAAALRLDTIDRIMEKSQTLDTFLDAKNVASVLAEGSSADAQYAKLQAQMEWIDPSNQTWKWIDRMVQDTRARNHGGLGRIKIHNIFKVDRPESDAFGSRIADIVKMRRGKGWTWPPQLARLGLERIDVENKELYEQANVIPLFHGSRTENFVGLLLRGLLIRPSGSVYTGSMFGDGIYSGLFSKACSYSSCRGTYWARGNDSRGYVLLMDVCLGDPKIVETSAYYDAKKIAPCHSVWAKAGRALINDEFILYHPTGPLQQHRIRYVLEVETQA
jgi:predicted DNA-binding WGR domain protein